MKNFKHLKNRYRLPGLTLIELVVSLFIISFVTAIFVTNYRTSNKRTDLVMTSQVIVSDIHRAQNNSLGLVKYGGEIPAGGWGINFDLTNKNRYVVFADLQAPLANGQSTSGYRMYDPYTEGDVTKGARIIDLPPEIELVSLKMDGYNYPIYSANVTFLPPDPQINIYAQGATSTMLEIGVKELQSNTVKLIQVNFLGLAEVLDNPVQE